ncbi:MAG TPA: EF-Tu/IF-2/RF-3 family GTPase [Nocardioides sp.]|nr:EF-Tu/IF-2/RF-3 family GTPase [Nocardioides sp.]
MAFWRRKKSEAEVSLEQLQAGAESVPAAPSGPFSMTIEDVFAITGRGTVVTGRIATGTIRTGMPVTVTTSTRSIATAVSAIEQFRRTAEQASAGDNVGLLLDGVARHDVKRGDVVTGGQA